MMTPVIVYSVGKNVCAKCYAGENVNAWIIERGHLYGVVVSDKDRW